MIDPPGWGDDRLSEFLAISQDNVRAALENIPEDWRRLKEIDHDFHSLVENLHELSDPTRFAAVPFCQRAHANYRAAAGLALAGQVYESYVVDRACLESALYGFLVFSDEDAFETWLDRPNGPSARAKMKRRFSARKAIESLRKTAPRLGAKAEKLYEATIELGAHPNPFGVLSAAEIDHSSAGVRFDTVYLADDPDLLRAALRTCAQAGLIALDVSCRIFPDRASVLGVGEELPRLAAGLWGP